MLYKGIILIEFYRYKERNIDTIIPNPEPNPNPNRLRFCPTNLSRSIQASTWSRSIPFSNMFSNGLLNNPSLLNPRASPRETGR